MSRISVTALFLACLSVPLSAQQALTGTITGSVVDATEGVVANAQVTARNVNTGLERTVTAGDLGLYTIAALPVGEYEVLAKTPGFNEGRVGSLRVGGGQQSNLPVQITGC